MLERTVLIGLALVLAQTALPEPRFRRGGDSREVLALATDAAALADSRVQLTADQHRQLQKLSSDLRRGQVGIAKSRWMELVAELDAQGAAIDVNALVQWVLRESYLQTTEDLRFYAEKVKYFNQQKTTLREALERASVFLRVMAERGESTAEIESFIEEFEEKLSTVGDDAQLANIDLQNKLQQQQQTLQAISNVSKMLYETAMSIIRKIG
jgi:hypothetical protein